MDTHHEILNYYPPSGETPVYDTITGINVSPFPSFLGPNLPLKALLALVEISLWTWTTWNMRTHSPWNPTRLCLPKSLWMLSRAGVSDLWFWALGSDPASNACPVIDRILFSLHCLQGPLNRPNFFCKEHQIGKCVFGLMFELWCQNMGYRDAFSI